MHVSLKCYLNLSGSDENLGEVSVLRGIEGDRGLVRLHLLIQTPNITKEGMGDDKSSSQSEKNRCYTSDVIHIHT